MVLCDKNKQVGNAQRSEGPITTDQNGNLQTPVLMCAFGSYRCRHFGVHDFHHFYCAAQDAPNKHAGPTDYAYPWHGAGKQLSENAPDSGCPYTNAMANETRED